MQALKVLYESASIVGYIAIIAALFHMAKNLQDKRSAPISYALTALALAVSFGLKAPYMFDTKRDAFFMLLSYSVGWLIVCVLAFVSQI